MVFPRLLPSLLQNRPDSLIVQAFRFLVVGAVAFAVDFCLLMVAVHVWNWHYLLSAALGYSVGLALNYFLTVRWVFSQRRFRSAKPEFVLFFLIGLTGLGVTELVLWTGHDLLGVNLQASKITALCLVAVWNFVLRKTILFTQRNSTPEENLGLAE